MAHFMASKFFFSTLSLNALFQMMRSFIFASIRLLLYFAVPILSLTRAGQLLILYSKVNTIDFVVHGFAITFIPPRNGNFPFNCFQTTWRFLQLKFFFPIFHQYLILIILYRRLRYPSKKYQKQPSSPLHWSPLQLITNKISKIAQNIISSQLNNSESIFFSKKD